MVDIEKVHELTGKLSELYQQQANLMIKLNRSLAIQEVCPDAFKFGACKTVIRNKIGRDLFDTFTITRGDGSKVVITDRDILPEILRNQTITETEKRSPISRHLLRKKERRYNANNVRS